MSLTQIIYKDINDDYGYGCYGEFEVIIMKKNGYINVTKLCQKENKRFDHWLENEHSKKLIKIVKKNLNELYGDELSNSEDSKNITEPIIIIKGSKKKCEMTRGTYAHQSIVVHVASWVSPDFAIWVSNIVNNYATREYRIKNDELITEISELRKLMRKMEKTQEYICEQNEELKRQNKHTHMQNNNLKDKITRLQDVNDEIKNKLETSLEDRVPKTKNKSKDEYLAVIKNTDKTYYVIRRQRCSIKTAIKNYIINNKKSKLIFISWNPNAVNNFNRIKENDKYLRKININGNTIRLRNSTTENEFIKILYEVNDEKYNQKKQRQMDDYIDNLIENFNIDSDDDFDIKCLDGDDSDDSDSYSSTDSE